MRLIELSHQIIPFEEEYKCEVYNRFVEELLPEYKRPPDAWYIMSEVNIWSHVGTHIEAPFHYYKNGSDVADLPLQRLVGRGLRLDFRHKQPGEPIPLEEIQERGENIQKGDIVFIWTGLSHNYSTSKSHERPYFTLAAIQWLVERDIACLGVDCSGIEKRDEPVQPDHACLFEHGIPLIEHLANLDQLSGDRFFVVAVPWRVKGLEASPVAVIAFENEDFHA